VVNVTYILGTPIGSSAVTYGDILILIAVIIIAIIIAKVVTINVRRAFKEQIPKNELEILLKIIYWSIIVLGVMVALPNVDLSGILIAGGIAGIILGFASQSVVSNFISGFFLLIERPIKIGDNIQVESISGIVEDIHILSTIIKTYDGIFTRIPNEMVFTSTITNFVANVARRFEYSISIRYEDDADRAIGIMYDLVAHHPFVLKKPSPSIFVDELGNDGVIIIARLWSPSTVWYDVKMELLWKIKVAIEAAGIEIPFPQRTVWFGQKGTGESGEFSELPPPEKTSSPELNDDLGNAPDQNNH
jgi:small-conductance mechanosensitive channel